MHNLQLDVKQFLCKNKTGLLLSVAISVLYVLPIILANTYYVDDMGRSIYGYSWTEADGRFLSSFIMRSLSLNPYIVVNLYPYYILISAAILALSGYLLSYLFKIEEGRTLKLTSLFLLVNPFFLSNLAFRYDCLPMTLSVFALILPFLFIEKSNVFSFMLLICSFLCFCLYQPSITSIYVIGSYYLFKYCQEDKLKLLFLFFLKLIIIPIFGYLLWRLSVYAIGIDLWGRGELSFMESNFFKLLSQRWISFVRLIKLLGLSYLIVVIPFLLLSVYAFIRCIQKLDLRRVIISVGILVFALFSTVAINFATNNAIMPRTQIAYGFAFFLLASMIVRLPKVLSKFRLVSFILIIFYSFLLSSLFGQTLKNQEDYNSFIVAQIAPFLIKHNNPELHLVGSIGESPRNEMTMRFYPILRNITPIYKDKDFIFLFDFEKFDLISKEYGVAFRNRETVLSNIEDYPIVDSNRFYLLKEKKGIFILQFPN